MGELEKWRKEKWVRIGTDGSILGACGTSKDKKNPDRCEGSRGKTVVRNTKAGRVTKKYTKR
jgi:hypothetical protein